MITKTVTFFSFAVSLVWIGCHYCTIQQSGSSTESATHSNPSALKQQVSYVTGVVDTVIIIDPTRYTISVRVTSVASGGMGESIAEPGQRVTLIPQFVNDADGKPDLSHRRSKKLISLRSAKSGDTIQCSIIYSIENGWMIIDTNPD